MSWAGTLLVEEREIHIHAIGELEARVMFEKVVTPKKDASEEDEQASDEIFTPGHALNPPIQPAHITEYNLQALLEVGSLLCLEQS